MNAIITIFKKELSERPDIIEALQSLSALREIDDAYILKPNSGALFDVLNFLKESKIAYGTHFDSLPAQN